MNFKANSRIWFKFLAWLNNKIKQIYVLIIEIPKAFDFLRF